MINKIKKFLKPKEVILNLDFRTINIYVNADLDYATLYSHIFYFTREGINSEDIAKADKVSIINEKTGQIKIIKNRYGNTTYLEEY